MTYISEKTTELLRVLELQAIGNRDVNKIINTIQGCLNMDEIMNTPDHMLCLDIKGRTAGELIIDQALFAGDIEATKAVINYLHNLYEYTTFEYPVTQSQVCYALHGLESPEVAELLQNFRPLFEWEIVSVDNC